jgi:phytoene synthase
MNDRSLVLDAAPGELGQASARAIIRRHSKSFSLASHLLDPAARENAHALYAYCRSADDAIDLEVPEHQRSALERLRGELSAVYAGRALPNPTNARFQRLVFELQIPKEYPEALLDGFEQDVSAQSYGTLSELHYYCWCVAGSVGAMMCHVLGASGGKAFRHGAHLGMGMQLTNICRDVAEDWGRGRLYVPRELLPGFEPGGGLPPEPQLASAVRQLLGEADALYRSGDRGLGYLPFRSRIAVATARRVYSSIGDQLIRRGCDVTRGRVFVPTSKKLWCVARAALDASFAPRSKLPESTLPLRSLRFPEDVLPL